MAPSDRFASDYMVVSSFDLFPLDLFPLFHLLFHEPELKFKKAIQKVIIPPRSGEEFVVKVSKGAYILQRHTPGSNPNCFCALR